MKLRNVMGIAFACAMLAAIAPMNVQAVEVSTESLNNVLAVSNEDTLYEYDFSSEGGIWITAYKGSSSSVTIPTTLDGYEVTGIGRNAFEGNIKLKSVVFPEGIESIGNGAFRNCKSLEKISFSSTINYLGTLCFENCTALKEVYIPKGIETFANDIYCSPFYGCSNLIKVEFEEGTLQIPEYAFSLVPVKTVIIPDTVTAIGTYAFNKTEIETLNLPTSVETIGNYGFAGTPIVSLEIPEGVKTIESSAFRECPVLKEISFSSTVNYLGEYSFFSCTALKEVYIPKGIETFEGSFRSSPFFGCSNLAKVEFEEGTLQIPKYAFAGVPVKTVIIPDTVTAIGEYAFDSTKIETLNLPTSVETIGDYGFGHTPIVSLEIPEGVKTIGSCAFTNCSKLEKISFSSTVNYLGESSFQNCTALKEVYIPKGIETFENNVYYSPFYNCSNLSKVEFEEGTLQIPKYAFAGVPVKTVIIPDTVTTIGEYAFYKTKIETPNIPTSVETIGDYGFAETPIVSLVIPEGVKTIGGWAFSRCTELEKISFSSTVNYLSKRCFEYCTALKEVYIPKGIETFEPWPNSSPFHGSSNLSKVEFEEGTIKIPENAFFDVPVKTLIIPETVTIIGEYAFTYTKIETLELPKSVETIEGYAFAKCNSLTEINISRNTTSIHEDAFGTSTKVVIYTPTDSYAQKFAVENGIKYVNEDIHATNIKINKVTATLEQEATLQLSVVIDPENCTDIIEWSSSDDTIAAVTQNGLVQTRKKAGTAVITVKVGEVTATCAVTVKGVQNGWKFVSGNWYYYKDGKMVKGWLYDGGAWYYMKPNGAMATGWVNVGGTWYYMKSSGAMATGWVNDGGTWYYMKSSGAMTTGWVKDGGAWYYMRSGGAMATGWVKDGGAWYYMKSTGVMATGWVKDGNTWYYMKSTGVMATGWVNDGGTWYYMKSSGAMATGWIQDGGTWYYLNSSGAWVR